MLDCLRKTYGNSSIDKLVKGYAPPVENDTKHYIEVLYQATGVNRDKKIKDFTAEEFEKLWKAIEKMEGFAVGEIVEVQKITQAYRNRHGIYDFNVCGIGWTSKEGCISLAKEGKLDVVLCTSHAGNLYLRARPNSSIQASLEALIIKKQK